MPAILVQHVQRDVPVHAHKVLREVRPHARFVHQVHQRAFDGLEVDARRPYFRQPQRTVIKQVLIAQVSEGQIFLLLSIIKYQLAKIKFNGDRRTFRAESPSY